MTTGHHLVLMMIDVCLKYDLKRHVYTMIHMIMCKDMSTDHRRVHRVEIEIGFFYMYVSLT